jgi:hypothetical protein
MLKFNLTATNDVTQVSHVCPINIGYRQYVRELTSKFKMASLLDVLVSFIIDEQNRLFT